MNSLPAARRADRGSSQGLPQKMKTWRRVKAVKRSGSLREEAQSLLPGRLEPQQKEREVALWRRGNKRSPARISPFGQSAWAVKSTQADVASFSLRLPSLRFHFFLEKALENERRASMLAANDGKIDRTR
jgi:hypothetical protein